MNRYFAYRETDKAWMIPQTADTENIIGIKWLDQKWPPSYEARSLDVLQAIIKIYCPHEPVVIIPDLKIGQLSLPEAIRYKRSIVFECSDEERDWVRKHLVAEAYSSPSVCLYFGGISWAKAYYSDLRGWYVAGSDVFCDDPIGAFMSSPNVASKVRKALEAEAKQGAAIDD